MTSPEEKTTLEDPRKLATSDPATCTNEQLLDAVKTLELYLRDGYEWSGRWIAYLHCDRKLTWSQLVALTGIPQTTLWNRASKYL
jgi:hypothetical protein